MNPATAIVRIPSLAYFLISLSLSLSLSLNYLIKLNKILRSALALLFPLAAPGMAADPEKSPIPIPARLCKTLGKTV